MFWVHDKFGNGLDDPDGTSWPTRLPNRIGFTQPNWFDPTTQTGQTGQKTQTGWVDLMIQTSLTTHTCRSCLSSSSTWPDTTRPNLTCLGHWPNLTPLGRQIDSTHMGCQARLCHRTHPTSLCRWADPTWQGRRTCLGRRVDWAWLGHRVD